MKYYNWPTMNCLECAACNTVLDPNAVLLDVSGTICDGCILAHQERTLTEARRIIALANSLPDPFE